MNPAKLIEQWESRADSCLAHVGYEIYRCANELADAHRRHPMSEEPEGVEGVEILLTHTGGDSTLIEWLGKGRWNNLPWSYWANGYPCATWCYLPPRGE